jgi:hypothetical protein
VAYHVADPFSGTVLTASIEDGGQERGASFSPKGTYLVGAAGNRIVIFKTADHSFSKVLDIEQMAVYGYMGLNDDETHFAWIDAFGFAEVVDLATGKALGRASLHDPNAGLQQQIAWVPGSSRVVFGCQESCTPELWGTKGKRISKLRVDGAEWGGSPRSRDDAGRQDRGGLRRRRRRPVRWQGRQGLRSPAEGEEEEGPQRGIRLDRPAPRSPSPVTERSCSSAPRKAI